jgi:hypothetical protein
MKRDMDLIRKILFACEAHACGFAPHPLQVEGYDNETIGFHVLLMVEAGLLEGTDVTTMADSSPAYLAQRMTWSGYEFLDAAREQATWNKAKGAIGTVSGVGFEIAKSVLVEFAKQQAKTVLGLV